MNLTGTETLYMTLEPKQTCHFCNLRNQVSGIYSKVENSNLSDKDKSYYAPFLLLGLANEFLALWLFLVASSCFLFSKNLNSFGKYRIKAAEEVSLPDRIVPNARANIENNATCHKYDAYSEISYLDKISYLDSLLSIELEEDTVWLSDSKSYELCSLEDPSTPLSRKYDSLSEILDIGSPNYLDSLQSLEGKESVRESYFDSLLSLEDEDTEWLTFEDPSSSTSLSQKCDSLSESDIGSPSYWDSLLKLEEKDNEWTYKGNCSALSSVSSVSSLTTTVQTEEFFGDEPLFWPFEEKLNWNYEKPWTSFCSSPRKRLVSEATSSPTPMIKECKQKINDALCSVKSTWSKSSAKIVVPLECEDHLNKTFLNENFASNFNDLPLGLEYLAMDQVLPIEALMGLKEFDGHEGLDTEFYGDNVFMLDKSLQ
ncbi:hypothetical protein TanjilG_05942 [Lupinus angustifolius]|uniref:Uncharacterized protein n=1 Tax=Lupinus angustifolius TaxID=3871 RepID=A0A4P1REU6_LUPAN|nr:PREDICTED: uncharacterized protein LOC109351002 [Lupinus angustifolius]OIW08966.1 hypothetical protein TanjilG_05942 [Lupinus angustifolius]